MISETPLIGPFSCWLDVIRANDVARLCSYKGKLVFWGRSGDAVGVPKGFPVCTKHGLYRGMDSYGCSFRLIEVCDFDICSHGWLQVLDTSLYWAGRWLGIIFDNLDCFSLVKWDNKIKKCMLCVWLHTCVSVWVSVWVCECVCACVCDECQWI